MKHAPLSVFLATSLLTVCHTVTAQAPPENLLVCARMADPAARLRCYDAQMTAMGAVVAAPPPAAIPPAVTPAPAAPAAPAVVPAPRTEVAAATPAPAPTAEQKFGAENLPPTTREKVDKPDKALVSTIASIKQVRPKLWLIVLANGQIWLQDGTQITMFFREGYDVRIEKGLLSGDYRMSTAQTGDKNWVRVSRIQ